MYEEIKSDNVKAECKGDLSNSGVFSINKNKARIYKARGIDRILFVFDADNQRGENNNVTDFGLFKSKLENLNNNMRESGITCEFIPVMYCAETIGLYQAYTGDESLIKFINSYNTKRLHRKVLQKIYNLGGDDIKQLRYVDYASLKEKLIVYTNVDNFNSKIIELLLNKDVIGYNYEEVCKIVCDINDFYNSLNSNIESVTFTYDGKDIEVYKLLDDLDAVKFDSKEELFSFKHKVNTGYN
jgi:hypothetical protein